MLKRVWQRKLSTLSFSLERNDEDLTLIYQAPWLDESQTLGLRGEPAEERKPEPTKIFLSYSDKQENEYLVENLVYNFLNLLGFHASYLKKNYDTRVGDHGHRARQLIEECGVLLAFFTNDNQVGDHYETKGNVADEVGMAKMANLTVICFYEKGNKVPSNVWGYTVPKPFEASKPAELLLEILEALKNADAFQ